MTNNVFYKIRRKKDGLFSTGTWMPSFKKNGKMWQLLSYLKKHIIHIIQGKYYYSKNHFNYDGCEIVKYDLVEVNSYSIDQKALTDEADKIAQEKREKAKQLHGEWLIREEKKEYERLRKKYD